MFKIIADDLPRFMTCNASRLMGSSLPPIEQETKYRDEGTAAHYMATVVFRGEQTLEELIDRKAPNGVFMTDEMAEHVAEYLAIIDKPERFYSRGMEIDTSHDFSPSWIVNGRCDWYKHYEHGFHFIDFKYGWSLVEPFNNWTLISHAIGFISQNRDKLHPNAIIDLSIFQPRPYHPNGPLRTWRITVGTLQALQAELTRVLCHPTDILQTSPHCKNCPAILSCPAARKAEMNSIDASETYFEDDVSNDLLSFNLDNLNRASEMIKNRLHAFEELAKHRIKQGQVVDNYSVDITYGHTRWNGGLDAATLQALTGKDLSKKELVTPAEAKRRGVDPDTIKTLTNRPMTGIKLQRVKASDKAERMFIQGNTKRTTDGN